MTDPIAGGYAQMPAGQPMAPVARGAAPASVLNAVKLMFVRAGLGELGLIVLFATKSSMKTQILKANPTADAAKLGTLLSAAVAVASVVGLIFIVLYVLLALQVGKGKNWARIVTWVLAAFGVLSALGSLVQTAPVASRLLSLIAGLIDIAIIVLLAQKRSSAYFTNTTV